MSIASRIALAVHVLREGVDASGVTVESDFNGGRLTGRARDLNPIAQARAREISYMLWRQNPMARRLVEMIVDFVVGEGITISAVDEAVQEVVDEFWADPVMRLDLHHRDFVRDLSLTGELALRSFEGLGGRSRIGYIDAERIEKVVKDPENALLDATIVLRRSGSYAGAEQLPIVNLDESDPSDPVMRGEAHYYAINRLTSGTRGTPDLLCLADWIDGYDQLLWNVIERSGLLNAFVWDVELAGSNDDEIDAWRTKHSAAPRPGSVRVHNEKERWLAVTPGLGASDLVEPARMIKNYAIGGAGIPEGWFGDGDAANRATLTAQGDPTYKMLTSRQRYVRYIFEDILATVVDRAVQAGRLPKGCDRSVTVNMPEPNEHDAKGIAAALPQLTTALTGAIDAELIDRGHARKVFLTLAAQLGVDLDADEVEQAIEDEQAEAEAEKPVLSPDQQAALAGLGNPAAQQAPGAPAAGDPSGNGQPVPPASPVAAPQAPQAPMMPVAAPTAR